VAEAAHEGHCSRRQFDCGNVRTIEQTGGIAQRSMMFADLTGELVLIEFST